MDSGPRDRDDVLRIIERRIGRNREMMAECQQRGETLDVEYLRGAIDELINMQRVVQALPTPSTDSK
jgi:hypothetical protein